MLNAKASRRQKIRYRIRKRVFGTAERPRMSVYKSNAEIYVQLIDDVNGNTIASASSVSKEVKGMTGTKVDKASAVGKIIAEKASEKSISTVVFDRGGFLYHGRVKALAEGARQGGLNF